MHALACINVSHQKPIAAIFLHATADVAVGLVKIYGFCAPRPRFIKLNKMHCLFEKAFSDPQLCTSLLRFVSYIKRTLKISTFHRVGFHR